MKEELENRQAEKREDVAKLRRKIRPEPDRKKYRKEIRKHFEAGRLRLKIAQTTRTPLGQTLDWIDIASQQPDGRIATPPQDSVSLIKPPRNRRESMIRFELESPGAKLGPEGTVPVLRKDLKKLRFATSLQDFLSKHGHRTYELRLDERHSIEVPGDGAHDYAYTAQYVACYGGEGYLSAYDPYTQWANEFSLQQIAVVRGSGNGKQTIEAGWQEYRDLYGDWRPHLFVFYTTNGYTHQGDNQGGYNRDVDGWVQYSRTVFPGALISPNSVRGGTQYALFIKYQLWEGNWWFKVGGEWLGYYPASLFNSSGLRSQAEKIAFYGEIVDAASHSGETHTDMGSGYWPEYRWPYAAYAHNLRYQHDTAGHLTGYNADSEFASDPDLYDLETHMNSGSTWGSYFWLGGPGA